MTPPATPVADVIGPYRVLRPIARGGMAEVYEVEDLISGERFALKLLVVEGSALPRFQREYEALTRLNHPNIVRVYQYGLHGAQPWVAMEYIQGTPMQAWVKNIGKPGDVARTKEIMRTMAYVADALDYIHKRGLVHRDLKSDNVLILPDGRVKLLDFGAARLIDTVDPITKDGEFVGTFAYAAPEQLAGAQVDARADLYALGVLLYRMCTGARPYETNDPVELARLHAKNKPVPPRMKVPELPWQLEKLILQLMERRPEARPERAKAVHQALVEMNGPLNLAPLSTIANADQAVGRETELRQVIEEIRTSDPGGAVLVEGGEGSGRIRFTRAVATALEDRGTLVMSLTLAEDRALPELIGLLDQISTPLRSAESSERRMAADLLHKQISQGGLDGPRRREAVRKAAGIALVERARLENRPILLVFHNLHVAPPAALDIIVGLRREAYTAKVNVKFLASCREESEEPDIMVRQRFPDARRVRLHPLSPRGVGLTVGTMLHRRPPAPDLARAIHAASGGQPAYVEEVVRELVNRHDIESSGLGGNRLEWTNRAAGILPLAPSAREATDRSLRRLPAIHRRSLETLTVAGDELPIVALAAGMGMSEREIEPVIDRLSDDAWIVIDEDNQTVRWDDIVAKFVLESQLNACRRDVIRRQLLVALKDLPPSAVRVRLLLEIERFEEAAKVVIPASEHLLMAGRVVLAAELLDQVVRRLTLSAGQSIIPDLHRAPPDLFLQHARALLLVRPTDPLTARSIAKALELAKDDRQRGLALYYRARLQSAIGHYPNYRKFLQEGYDHAVRANEPRLQSSIATHLGQIYGWIGQPKSCEDWLEKAQSTAKAAHNRAAEAYGDAALAATRYARGELVESERLAATSMDRMKAIGHPRGVWGALPTWANSLREQGRFSESLSSLTQALVIVRESESPSHYVALLLCAAREEIDLARLGKAQELVDELESAIRPGEHLHLRLETRLMRGRILVASGVYHEAVSVLMDVHQRAKAAELVGLAEIARALRGEAQWATGARDDALVSFRDSTLGLLGSGDLMSLCEAITVRARSVCEHEDPEPLFDPVRTLIDGQPLHRVKMEALIARARHLAVKGDVVAAFHAWRDAATLLNKVAGSLGDIERAALRVHPWSRAVRRGLKR